MEMEMETKVEIKIEIKTTVEIKMIIEKKIYLGNAALSNPLNCQILIQQSEEPEAK